jgi:hypothetical protein
LIFRNKTPVHYAAKAGNLKTLQLLIEKGALSGILKSGKVRLEERMSKILKSG